METTTLDGTHRTPPEPTWKLSTSSEKQSQTERRGGRRERQREKGTRVGVCSAWTGPGDGRKGGGRRVVAETESDGPTREREIGLGHHRYRGPTENVRAPLSHVLVTTTSFHDTKWRRRLRAYWLKQS